jgi:hypothetical protein
VQVTFVRVPKSARIVEPESKTTQIFITATDTASTIGTLIRAFIFAPLS